MSDVVAWLMQYGVWGLVVVAFTESSFFPIPPDTLLIPMALLAPEKAYYYAFLVTSFSVFGALLGYAIGHFFGHVSWVKRLLSGSRMVRVKDSFERYGGYALFVAGFTPIPFKVFTIAGGMFGVPLLPFVIGSVLGRGMRFFLVVWVVLQFGDDAIHWIETYGAAGTLAIAGLLLLLTWLAYRWYKRRAKRK